MNTRRINKNDLFFNPFSVGFDDLFNMATSHNSSSYPPYNILKEDETHYTIEVAVAGFTENDLEVTLDGNKLSIVGKVEKDSEAKKFLYRGIANRNFSHTFTIADNVEVSDVSLEDGMLVISLEKYVPEEEKPKKLTISKKREFLAE